MKQIKLNNLTQNRTQENKCEDSKKDEHPNPHLLFIARILFMLVHTFH
tara:strand:- start:1247 stop:1390 length:144 start_codon:yes stop_codon:yes gene_type:complete